MYCSNCGNKVKNGLKYCNSCGGRIVKDEVEKTSTSIIQSILIAGTIVTVSGLGCLIGLVAILFFNRFPFEYIMFVTFVFLLALFGISFMFLRPVSKFMSAEFEKKDDRAESYQPPQLSEPTVAQLNEPIQPIASVTEHTTRTLDEVLVERR